MKISTSNNYILDGKKAIKCDDLMEWAKWFENCSRRVELTERNNIKVSTVFLGLDHSFGNGKPMLFETMIFGGPHSEFCSRYTTWEEAEAGHTKACELAFGKEE